MKKNYEIPETLILQTEMDPFMLERMSQGEPVVGPTDAKEQQIDVIEEESLPVDKNIWEDDEE